jgi:hypothetical protein
MASQEMYKHKCHICYKSFTRGFTLRNHLNAHKGENPFSCTVCPQRFTRDHDRKVHEKEQHINTQRYPCWSQLPNGQVWGCGSVFSRKASLQRHLNSDIGRACRPHSDDPSPLASDVAQWAMEIPVDSFTPEPPGAPGLASSSHPRGSNAITNLNAGRGMQAFNTVQSMTRIPRECLTQSPSVRDTEVILLQLKPYFMWNFTAKGLPCDRESFLGNVPSDFLYYFTSFISLAIYGLDRNVPQQPWKLINAGCEIVGQALREQDRHLLVKLFVLFCDKTWAKFPDLHRCLLRHLDSVAQQVLGLHHPLATTLRLVKKEDTLFDSAEPVLRLMLDVAKDAGSTSGEICSLVLSRLSLFTTQGKFLSAGIYGKVYLGLPF